MDHRGNGDVWNGQRSSPSAVITQRSCDSKQTECRQTGQHKGERKEFVCLYDYWPKIQFLKYIRFYYKDCGEKKLSWEQWNRPTSFALILIQKPNQQLPIIKLTIKTKSSFQIKFKHGFLCKLAPSGRVTSVSAIVKTSGSHNGAITIPRTQNEQSTLNNSSTGARGDGISANWSWK